MAAPQPSTSPGRNRGFSLKSDKSHRSSESGHRSQLSESSEEKARRNLHTKADPLVAMNEAQPMSVALEKSNLGSLRGMQHKDQYGNVITEPDLSNPTRPRFERPLDTIRSFEAAIYGTYSSNRMSYARTDDASQVGDYSRRTSYYGGPNGYMSRGYSDQNGYNGGRGNQSRPDSLVDAYQGSAQPQDSYYPYNQGGRSRPRHYSRMSSDQAAYGTNSQYGYAQQDSQYPPQAPQRAYDNVTPMSGSGSAYTDAYGQSTDPSSLNSSMEFQQQVLYQQRLDEAAQADAYGFQGFGPNPNLGSKNLPPVPAPMADHSWGGPVGGGAPATASRSQNYLRKDPSQSTGGEKRKSWFKRRFSKD